LGRKVWGIGLWLCCNFEFGVLHLQQNSWSFNRPVSLTPPLTPLEQHRPYRAHGHPPPPPPCPKALEIIHISNAKHILANLSTHVLNVAASMYQLQPPPPLPSGARARCVRRAAAGGVEPHQHKVWFWQGCMRLFCRGLLPVQCNTATQYVCGCGCRVELSCVTALVAA
jgi:hypothetical protein